MSTLPDELGDLVETHRPMRGYTGWVPVLLVPTVVGLFAALSDPGPLIGALLFLGLFVPIMFATAEWFLLEHRIHRHGIVFRSLVPGMKTYVVPYYTCDPDSFGTNGRQVHDGSDVTEMINRRFRQCPLTRTNVTMLGLDPSVAMAIGSGRSPWSAGTSSVTVRYRSDGSLDVAHEPGVVQQQTWLFSSRAPEHHASLLRDLIIADRDASPTPPGSSR